VVVLSGGSELEKKLAELSKNVRKAASVRVGFLENSTYPDGTSVALVAAINEWGQTRIHPHQPPRPFFRGMIKEKSPGWPDAIAKLLMKNNYDADVVLSQVGRGIANQLTASIRDFTTPGLAMSTVERKIAKGGFGTTLTPLKDTGHMMASVQFEVES
jgi:hypothetical protein